MKRIFPYIVLLASLSLAGTAAYYSVFGLSKLFSAQAFAVVIMASILEASKLITASYLHRFWKQLTVLMKLYLTTAIIVLMMITSLGIYGFLVSAYQETAYELENVEQEVAMLQLKRDRFQEQLIDIQEEKTSLNTNISELTAGLSNNVIQYTNSEGQLVTTTSSSTRKALQEQLQETKTRRDTLYKKEIMLTDSISYTDVKILKLKTESEVSAEIGPLKYVAKLSGRNTDSVINWFILLFIFVFDPLAVVLLIGANKALVKSNNNSIPTETVSIPEADPVSEQITKKKPIIKQVPTQTKIEQVQPIKKDILTNKTNTNRKILRSE